MQSVRLMPQHNAESSVTFTLLILPPHPVQCYKQPKVPASYAPRRVYMKPTAPVEGCTTYKLSYLPVECKNLRGEARKPTGNIILSCAPMEGETIQKVCYLDAFFTSVLRCQDLGMPG